METFDFTLEDGQMKINGVADGHYVLALGSQTARRLSDMAAHRADLGFVLECLKELEGKEYNPNSVVQNALWHSAIVHYVKCFAGGNGGRGQLSANKIFKDQPSLAMHWHGYFDRVRNRQIVHVDKAWTSLIPMAVINDGSKGYKVEKILCSTMDAHHFNVENYNNLQLLADTAFKWVEKEFDDLADRLTAFLEGHSYAELSQMPPPKWTVPDIA